LRGFAKENAMIRKPNLFHSNPAPPPTNIDNFLQYHIVKRGETLSKIAEAYYGDPSHAAMLLEANSDVLSQAEEIFPGQKLRIP
jgi:nucleoid-associated protein YgaU